MRACLENQVEPKEGGGVNMSHWEDAGKSSDWRTPGYVFEKLGVASVRIISIGRRVCVK